MLIRVRDDKALRVQLNQGLFVRPSLKTGVSFLDRLTVRDQDLIPGGERVKILGQNSFGQRAVVSVVTEALDLDYVLFNTDSGVANNFVRAVNVDNGQHGNLSGLEGTLDDLLGIDYDSDDQWGFTANEAEGSIKRFKFTQDTQILFSANNVSTFISGEGSPDEVFGILVDTVNGFLWWSLQGAASGTGTLRRASLTDGSGKTTVFTSSVRMRGLAFDPVNNLMYFGGGASGVGDVWQIDLDAGTEQRIISDATNGQWIAIDPNYEYIFHHRRISPTDRRLVRHKISDGSEVVLSDVGGTNVNPAGIAVTDQNKVYWVQPDGVYKADLDLTNAEAVKLANSFPRDLCLVYNHVSNPD